MKLTFNAKTGQTYTRPEPVPGLGVIKRKRTLDESERRGTSPKRASVEGGGVQAIATSPSVPTPVEANSESGPPKPVSNFVLQAMFPVLTRSFEQVCGNKTCHRVLPANALGNLCERCREKVKKKQAKAKQRFKLEPKKSNIVVKSGPVGGGSSDAAASLRSS